MTKLANLLQTFSHKWSNMVVKKKLIRLRCKPTHPGKEDDQTRNLEVWYTANNIVPADKKLELILKIPVLVYKGCRPKKNSIFTDIVQIGGREVNPISKI